jgi:NADPH-dependent glutamate synthase beta subunit-like oxidoreductase
MLYDLGTPNRGDYVVDEKRQQRKERRLVQSESRWMQKALFALNKAEDAREKLAQTRQEEGDAAVVNIGGQDLSIDALRTAIQERVETLAEVLQERRQVLR